MTKYFLVFVLLLPINCFSQTHKDIFDKHYDCSVRHLNSSGYPGPLSQELAKVALARQILEDGPKRKSDESIAGISIGSWNKDIVESTVPSHIRVKSISDSSGARFYHFVGQESNLYSMLVISKLFDFYVPKFMKSKTKDWYLAKETSKAIAQDSECFKLQHRFHTLLNPSKIINVANKLYGPGHQSVVDIYTR